jgi:pimeloyl-ACP methyl ester carboxylesterase
MKKSVKSILTLVPAIFSFSLVGQASGFEAGNGNDFVPPSFQYRSLSRRVGRNNLDLDTVSKFSQRIDHFNPNDSRTFQQRYVFDTKYAKAGAASPVVFYICGEGNCMDGELGGSEQQLAEKLGANLVALEHRFYGESQPFAQMTASNLAYLTMEQAIEDLAEFQKWISATEGLTGKWVAIGGSYPADLAAVYRLKHPELVSGAIASSACAKFSQGTDDSDRVAAQAAGSSCVKKYRDNILEPILLARGDRAAMAPYKAAFDAADITDDLDFIGALTGMAIFDVQEMGAHEFCASLDAADPLKGFALHFNSFIRDWGTRLIDWSYTGLASTAASRYEGSLGFRQWVYQGCTQIGVFSAAIMKANANTAESLSSVLTDSLPAKYCEALFGLAQPPTIDEMNRRYYAPMLAPSTSNILFVSGSNDPACFPFSISKENGNDTNPNTRTFTVQGGTHCEDLQPPRLTDSSSLQQARALELELAEEWVK